MGYRREPFLLSFTVCDIKFVFKNPKKLMFRLNELGLVLSSRDCVVLTARRRGEVDEQRTPALAQVVDSQIRAVGHRAYRLVGKSNDIVCVFPGRLDDPTVLGGYLERVVPQGSALQRRRLWACVPTASSLQMQIDLRNCFDSSLRPKDTVLVPEILAAGLGAGLPVLQSEEDSHRARMVVHFGTSRVSSGVFIDGSLTGLVIHEGSWDRLIREVQENLQFRLGTGFGFNTFAKVVRTLSRTFFERQLTDGARKPVPPKETEEVEEELSTDLEPSAEVMPEVSAPTNLRSFNERGLIEYVTEDPVICRSIDIQLQNLLFSLEKVVYGCFSKLRGSGRGEIASDLFSDRIMLCGEIYFDTSALARYFSRLTRFRFEAVNTNATAKGLRRIMTAESSQKKSYRDLSASINQQQQLALSYV